MGGGQGPCHLDPSKSAIVCETILYFSSANIASSYTLNSTLHVGTTEVTSTSPGVRQYSVYSVCVLSLSGKSASHQAQWNRRVGSLVVEVCWRSKEEVVH